jgi:hypothetical protein
MKSLMICRLTQYFAGDKIKNNKVDDACSEYKGGGNMYRILVGKRDGKRPQGETQTYMEG